MKLKYNVFQLAEMQLRREGKQNAKNAYLLLLDRAETISKWLDISNNRRKIAIAKWRKYKKEVC
jgi:hypothetical protein